MNNRIYWNNNWKYLDSFSEQTTCNDWEAAKEVCLPHTVQETPLHYFSEDIYQKVCGYKKTFSALKEWKDKHVLMTIEAAGHSAWVYLNGELLTEHHCGYTAFTVDLSKNLYFDKENELIIKVDSREDQNVPPFGYVIDYMTFGGLYREIYIEIKNKYYIEDVFVKTKRNNKKSYKLKGDVTICDGSERFDLSHADSNMSELSIVQTLLDIDGKCIREFDKNEVSHKVHDILEWNIDTPSLYFLKTDLYYMDQLMDTRVDRFGFREVVFKEDGFYLNDEKIKIRGLNRHQSYPYVGYAMPKSMQRYDAEILKYELGANAVRTSHYPQSHHFIDRCDELGLLVFTEIPGWQHIGDDAWKNQAVVNTQEMVRQYRNHPSIILWGVRINESQDNDEFYKRTNEASHALDDTRQTSGVRCIPKSSLLEDVYAYNDFSHEGTNAGCQKKKKVTSDEKRGYFISEYNGHMFPTKSFDTEDHRVEHLLRHARVMDAYYEHEDIAGGFAWCMFDYNTHQDFGSGDRVCYHGVCDMFRNPKLAASVYHSQQEQENVLEISSSMDIGEHPACLMKDVYAVTNADSVKLYKNDTFVREFYAKETPFKNIPHGPILIDDFIGNQMETGEGFSKSKSDDVKTILMAAGRYGMSNLPLKIKLLAVKCIVFRGMKMQDAVELYNKYVGNWGGTATAYKFEAIKNGSVVKTIVKKPMKEAHLEVVTSHVSLKEENTYDVAEIRIHAVSEEGNILNFSQAPVQLQTEGDIEIIGPSMISLQGGMGGTYIKTIGKTGNARLIITSESLGQETIEFTINR